MIFQDPFEAYNPFYRVDHVLETPVLNFGLAGSRREARRMIEETLRAVGLRPEETLGRYPHQLSGGQRQRIMVARALLIRPRVIIADEPVSMVDASLRATILASLRELHDEFGISLIYITHDLTTAYQISQNVIVLYRGLVAEAGDAEQVVRRPQASLHALADRLDPLSRSRSSAGKARRPRRAEGVGASEHGCRFAPRCPSAMAICRESAPPMFRTDRIAPPPAILYRDGEVVPGDRHRHGDGPGRRRSLPTRAEARAPPSSDLASEPGIGDLVESDRDQEQRDEQDADDDDRRQPPPPPAIDHRAGEVDPIERHAERRRLEHAEAQHVEPDRGEDRRGDRSDQRGHQIGQQIRHQSP